MSEFVSENEILKYSNKLRVCFSCILKFLSYNVLLPDCFPVCKIHDGCVCMKLCIAFIAIVKLLISACCDSSGVVLFLL